jgi:ABC-type amino acid transport substrate-binding protein
MFAALLLVASFTASITSLLTVAELESRVGGPADLKRLTVASVSGSTSEDYLSGEGIHTVGKPQLGDCLQALAEHRADAVVYDAPILQYYVNRDFSGELVVLPVRFERQDYGIGLPEASPYREGLNQAMLKVIEGPSWQQTVRRYLGGSQDSWDEP